MSNYKELDLSALLLMVKERDDGAFTELVDRYTPMLNKVVGGFLSTVMLYDEAFSEACVALHRAAMSYDVGRTDVTFGLYARICAYRRLLDAVSKESKSPQIVDTDVDTLYVESNIETRLVGRERMREYLKKAHSILSDYEYRVFLCYINGESTQEIAAKLSQTRKSVENAKSRMLKRLREESDIFSDV